MSYSLGLHIRVLKSGKRRFHFQANFTRFAEKNTINHYYYSIFYTNSFTDVFNSSQRRENAKLYS